MMKDKGRGEERKIRTKTACVSVCVCEERGRG